MALAARRRHSINVRQKTVLPDADGLGEVVDETGENFVRDILLSWIKMWRINRKVGWNLSFDIRDLR